MKRPQLAIPEDQARLIYMGATLLFVAIFVAFYIHRIHQDRIQQGYISQEEASRYTLEQSVNAAFSGRTDNSADASALNRLVRGKLTDIDDQQQRITVATYINFPDIRVTRPITLLLTPRTQFLCWSKTYRTEDGITIDVEQAGYLLDENTKLFQRGEKRIDLQAANDILSKHRRYNETSREITNEISVLVALEMPFSLNRENRVFQVALLGCDDD